jgi:integrase
MTTGIRLAIRSSVERRRAAGAAAAQTRPGAAIAVRVDVRARRAVHDAGWRKMVVRLGVVAKLGFKAHPHMFRHACGFQLANQGTGARTSSSGGRVLCAPSRGGAAAGGIGHVAVDPISV